MQREGLRLLGARPVGTLRVAAPRAGVLDGPDHAPVTEVDEESGPRATPLVGAAGCEATGVGLGGAGVRIEPRQVGVGVGLFDPFEVGGWLWSPA